jgi:hypothetical protein
MRLTMIAPLLAAVFLGTPLEFPRSALAIHQSPQSPGLRPVSADAVAEAASNACDGDAPVFAPHGLSKVSYLRPIGGKQRERAQAKPEAQQQQEPSLEGVPAFRRALHVCTVDRFDPRRSLGLQKVVYTL